MLLEILTYGFTITVSRTVGFLGYDWYNWEVTLVRDSPNTEFLTEYRLRYNPRANFSIWLSVDINQFELWQRM